MQDFHLRHKYKAKGSRYSLLRDSPLGHGSLWVNFGWYWDPRFGAYTFIPADGIFYSPFGWGYYSPWRIYGIPYTYYGHGFNHFDGIPHFDLTSFGTGAASH